MFKVSDEVDIHIGTLSKGFGSHGGFVACSHMLKSLLMNKGRSYVFSTALPLPAVAAAQAAITVCEQVRYQTQMSELIHISCCIRGPVSSKVYFASIYGKSVASEANPRHT